MIETCHATAISIGLVLLVLVLTLPPEALLRLLESFSSVDTFGVTFSTAPVEEKRCIRISSSSAVVVVVVVVELTSPSGEVLREGVQVLTDLLLGIIDELPCLHLDDHLLLSKIIDTAWSGLYHHHHHY